MDQKVKSDIIRDLCRPRTVFAFMFYFTMCYLIIKQIPVPESLKSIVSFLLGFYFGQRTKRKGGNR